MKTFKVCLTRDITESAVVKVEAQNEDEVRQVADAVILLAKIAMEPFIATRPSNRALAAIEQYQKGE